jgi:hypothetical protein
MADKNQKRTEEKKDNKAIIIIIILLLIIVIGLAVVIAFLLGRKGNDTPQNDAASSVNSRRVTQSTTLIEDEESAQSIVDQMREEVEEGMFECKMSMKWNFDDGKSESRDAYVANSDNNKFPFYFDVRLYDGSDELLYESPIITVGNRIDKIKLDKELPAGTYEAVVMYTLIRDVETQEPVSSAGFVIDIIVDN